MEQGRKLDGGVCQVAASQVPDWVAASVLDAWGLPPTRGGGWQVTLWVTSTCILTPIEQIKIVHLLGMLLFFVGKIIHFGEKTSSQLVN